MTDLHRHTHADSLMPGEKNGEVRWTCWNCGATGPGDFPASHIPCPVKWTTLYLWSCDVCGANGCGDLPPEHLHPDRNQEVP